MNIQVVAVGKVKEKYLRQGIAEYLKRLSRYCRISVTEVADEKVPETLSEAERAMVKQKEGKRILNVLRHHAFTVVLDMRGCSFTSEEFAAKLQKLALGGISDVDFVIGGSLGLDDEVVRRADLLLSFSKFTFPHQLVRLILLEQIYRAFRIIRGEPYHK